MNDKTAHYGPVFFRLTKENDMSTRAVRSEIHEKSLDHNKMYVTNHEGALVELSNDLVSQESVTLQAISVEETQEEKAQVELKDEEPKKLKNALVSTGQNASKKKEESKKKK